MKENEKQDLKQNLIIFILFTLVLVAVFIILYTRKKHFISKLQHEKKLAEIAYLNAHQTRAPLATLLGLLYLIDKTKLQDEETMKLFDMIIETARKLDEVIHQINDKAQKVENEKSMI
jgi:signal transduction histidine kinase